jgi:hypothetical protein
MVDQLGLSLDENWDLYVDGSTGDLAIDEGPTEIRKDLAFNVGRLLEGEVGDFVDDGRAADIKLKVKKLLQGDPRIASVESIDVTIPENQPDELDIDAVLITEDGETIDTVLTAA